MYVDIYKENVYINSARYLRLQLAGKNGKRKRRKNVEHAYSSWAVTTHYRSSLLVYREITILLDYDNGINFYLCGLFKLI